MQGSGSGIDVLASIHGGMGRVESHQWAPLPPLVPVVTFAGRSARTGPRVEQYRAWSAPDRARFVARSTALVDAFAHDPIAAFRDAWRLLVHMAEQTGIAYSTPELRTIVDVAESLGGGAKPSGAGGGDCTVAFFQQPADAERFRSAMRAHGLHSVQVAPGARHVTS